VSIAASPTGRGCRRPASSLHRVLKESLEAGNVNFFRWTSFFYNFIEFFNTFGAA